VESSQNNANIRDLKTLVAHNKPEYYSKDVEKVVEAVFKGLSDLLASGCDAVVIRGFGTFKLGNYGSRTWRNPFDGKVKRIPNIPVIRFKPSIGLANKVKTLRKNQNGKNMD